MVALAVGKVDVTGATRQRQRDRGHALAGVDTGKSTLNRLASANNELEDLAGQDITDQGDRSDEKSDYRVRLTDRVAVHAI